jgi:ligand-binding SRPBCC domain-containing protein
MYQYKTEHWLPISIGEAWIFFSSPKNLSLITPPEMDFKILTTLDGDIYEGMIIDYKVKPLLGIAVSWQTEICKVETGKYFTDRQLKGPYKVWEHTHTFTESNGGVLMSDEVKYELPFSFIGKIAHHFFIRNKIENIFNFRKNALNKMFKKK